MNTSTATGPRMSTEMQMLRQRVAQLEDVGAMLLRAAESSESFMSEFEVEDGQPATVRDLSGLPDLRKAISVGLKVI